MTRVARLTSMTRAATVTRVTRVTWVIRVTRVTKKSGSPTDMYLDVTSRSK